MHLSRQNNFDFIRLVAAWLVLVSHCYPLYGLTYEGFAALTGMDTLGGLAVSVFFIISGFLITASFDRNPNLRQYMTNRLLRILPGLIAVTLFTVLILGPVMTTLDPGTYFTHPQTRHYLWTMTIYKVGGALPGVFEDIPYKHAVNGSLWTLGIEFSMYLGVAALGMLGMLNRRFLPWVAAGLFILHLHIVGTPYAGKIIFYMPFGYVVKYGAVYFMGACMYVYREHIPIHLGLFVLSVALLIGFARTAHAPIALMLFMPYIVLYLAYADLPFARNVSRYGDFSYGFYIYAFPMQQVYMSLVGDRYGFMGLLIGSSIATLVCAAASWHLVEKPALKLKTHSMRPVADEAA